MNTKLQKKTKQQLWLLMCLLGIINGDTSLYNIRGWLKQDMIEAIEQHRREKEMV